jgi:hypothetical protein
MKENLEALGGIIDELRLKNTRKREKFGVDYEDDY